MKREPHCQSLRPGVSAFTIALNLQTRKNPTKSEAGLYEPEGSGSRFDLPGSGGPWMLCEETQHLKNKEMNFLNFFILIDTFEF